MSTLMLPAGIVEQINKYPRHCFGRKCGTEDRGTTFISWDKVCVPKDQGGLGFIDIATHNKCLLMKYLHIFLHHHDLSWVNLIWETYYSNGQLPGDQKVGSFWWKSNLALIDQFKAIARCNVGDGRSALFWEDMWRHFVLKHKFDHLYSFA